MKGNDPSTAVLVFRGSDVYQRIAPKSLSVAAAVLSSAASNLEPLVDMASASRAGKRFAASNWAFN